jgi:hypothetical protein
MSNGGDPEAFERASPQMMQQIMEERYKARQYRAEDLFAKRTQRDGRSTTMTARSVIAERQHQALTELTTILERQDPEAAERLAKSNHGGGIPSPTKRPLENSTYLAECMLSLAHIVDKQLTPKKRAGRARLPRAVAVARGIYRHATRVCRNPLENPPNARPRGRYKRQLRQFFRPNECSDSRL